MSNFTINVTASEAFADNTPITRAMLRNAAVPIVSATGSVGSEFIQAGAITNAKISTTAADAIDYSKIKIPNGYLLRGSSAGLAEEFVPHNDIPNTDDLPAANGTDGNVKVVVDTGTKFEALVTNLSGTGGHVSIQRYTANNGTKSLKLMLNTGVVDGGHLKSDVVDGVTLTKNSGTGKLEVLDGGVGVSKIKSYKDSDDNAKSAFLGYGASGTAKNTEITASDQVLVSAGTSNDLVTKSFFKNVDLLTTLLDSTGWKRVAHGLGTVPIFAELFLVCTGDTHVNTHKYAIGDVFKPHHDWTTTVDHNKSSPFNIGFDGTYVWVHHLALGGTYQFPKKYGTASPDSSTHSGTNADQFDLGDVEGDFKLVARVCG